MAAREPYKVHSLKKHIADTKSKPKGTPIPRPTSSRIPSGGHSSQKGKSGNELFGNNDDESDHDTDMSSDEDGDDRDDFIAKLGATNGATKRRPIDDEIADSDDERQAAAAKKSKPHQKQTVPKAEPESSDVEQKPKIRANGFAAATTSEESSEDSSDSDSESESNVKKESAKDKVSETSSEGEESSSEESESASKSDSSAESGSESESDESDSSEAPPKKTSNAVAQKPAKKAASTSSSSSEEDSDDESESSEESEKPKPKAQSKPAPKKVPEPETTSSSEEDDEDDEESEPKPAKALPLLTRKDGKQATVPTVLHNSSDSTDIAEICKQARQQGKELWYFVAPSDAVVSVAHNLEISMDEARRSNGVVSHKGENYGVSVSSLTPKSTIQVVLPSTNISQYRLASQQPSQIMQLKRLPQLDASSANVGPASKPKARVQPAGLNARFKPIGVYDPAVKLDPLSQPDTIMEDVPDAASSQKKKKEKGSKKRKLTPSEEDAEAAAYQLLGESQEAENNTKKQKTARPGSPDLGSAPRAKAASAQPVATPAKKSKSSASKEKKAKATPVASNQTPATKQTPVPLPSRNSHVPLPSIPASSQPKRSPVPIPMPPTSSAAQSNPTPSKPEKPKKSKSSKGKDKEKRPALQHSSSAKSETPVLPPMVKGMD